MPESRVATRPAEREMAAQVGFTAHELFERARAAELAPARGLSLADVVRSLVAAVRRDEETGIQVGPGMRHLQGLEAAGCVVLSGRRVPYERRRLDHVIVAPSGVYAVTTRPWRGQVGVNDDELYFDGRVRAGLTEQARAVAAALQELMADELRPQGVPVIPMLCLLGVETRWQTWQVQGVEVVPGPGLIRYLRHAQPVMGQETVVRLALAADRLLEQA